MSLQASFTDMNPFEAIVLGYLRNIQIHHKSSHHIIPELVEVIIMMCFFDEYFTITDDHDVTIDNSNPNKFSSGGNTTTMYGNIKITNNNQTPKKYSWTFKCLDIDVFHESTVHEISTLIIGIIDASEKVEFNQLFTTSTRSYGFVNSYAYGESEGFCCSGYHHSSIIKTPGYHPVDKAIKLGDEITMELDTNNKTLMYYKGKNKIGTWFKNVKFDQNTIYNISVSMKCIECCLDLIDFKVMNIKN